MFKRILVLVSAILGVKAANAEVKSTKSFKMLENSADKVNFGKKELKLTEKIKESGVKVRESKSADGVVCGQLTKS